MIIRNRPSAWRLFFVLKGSVVSKVLPQIGLSAIVAVCVCWFREYLVINHFTLTPVPFSLIGLALAIFLGFKNTAAYDRYWEARKLWGELIIVCRSFARQLITFGPEARPRAQLVYKCIEFSYALRDRLRGGRQLDHSKYALSDTSVANAGNYPDAILRSLASDLRDLSRERRIEPQYIQSLDSSLNALAHVLGGCERIRSTPIPFSYTLLLHRTAYLYCFLLPFGLVESIGWAMPIVVAFVSYTFFALEALGEELEEPFGVTPNDLPLSQICRAIEISLLDALGEPTPPELEAVDFQLT